MVALHQAGYEWLNAVLDATGSPWELTQPTRAFGCTGTNCETGFEPERVPFEHWETPLGTDSVGRDLLATVVWGTLPTMQMLLAGAAFASGMAIAVGLIAGYGGGLVDSVLMTVTDVVLSLPGLPFTIVLLVVLDATSPLVVGVLLASTIWPALARSIRATVLEVRQRDCVEASRAMGQSWPTVIRTSVLPSVLPTVLMTAVLAARRVLFDGLGLYFLGFQPAESTSNWGVLLQRAYVHEGALTDGGPGHLFAVPAGATVMLAMGLVSLSLGTDRLFDPRVRASLDRDGAGDGDDEGEDDGAESDDRDEAPPVARE